MLFDRDDARVDARRALPILREAAERMCKALLDGVSVRRRERGLQILIDPAPSAGCLDPLGRTHLEVSMPTKN